jgi:hypothetical protein
MRRSGELLDELKEFIQTLLRRVRVETADIAFRPEATPLTLASECDSSALGALDESEPSLSALGHLHPDVTTEAASFGCDVAAENYAAEYALVAVLAEDPLPRDLGSVGYVPALPDSPETRCLPVPGAHVSSVARAVPTIAAARTLGRFAALEEPPTYRATHQPARGRIYREDWRAAEAPLVRRGLGARLTGRAAIAAMRALVSATGLPPAAFELVGVFDRVPVVQPRKLTVDSDGKRVRLWYPVGARSDGSGRVAVARVRESGQIHATVVPPG